MRDEIGDKSFPIWLLGDSNPKNWQDVLEYPLDPRHPARHNIWTPILDAIQEKVFKESRKRFDTSSIYIRNAIENPSDKPPENQTVWGVNVDLANKKLNQLFNQYQPVLVLCFGAFSFEFVRRALKQEPKYTFGYWGAKKLGVEFRQRINEFDLGKINALPLLHTSISRGRFIESHNYFTELENGNYFDYTGKQIADVLLAHFQQFKIWIT